MGTVVIDEDQMEVKMKKCMSKSWICVIAVHKEHGASNWRRLYQHVESYESSIRDWYHRFGAYFDTDPLWESNRSVVKIEALKSWLLTQRFQEIAVNEPVGVTKSLLITPAVDEFFEIVYDVDLKEPRIRILSGN